MANSKIYLGNTNIGSLYEGASDISIYLGENKVYPLAKPKWVATYQDSHIKSAQCDSSSAITQNEINLVNLVSVELGDCVTSIGDMAFMYCKSLTSINIPDSVTSIDYYAFGYCSGLTSCTIGSGVTSIGHSAFYGCYGLTSIDIPSGVTSIGNSAFGYCSGLTSCTIGSGVTSIDNLAFRNCTRLTSITVNAVTPPTLGEYAFDETNNCPIYVPCESVDAYKAAWTDYASRITCVEPVFEGKWKATYSNGNVTSAECDSSSAITEGEINLTNLVSVEIGDCVTSIGFYAFTNCDKLTSVAIPDSVTSIGESAFEYCTSLTSATIGSGVTSIGESAFENCTSLTSINIPNSVTSIGDEAFINCNGLASITVEAVAPPTLGSRVFDGSTCSILVPSQSVPAYRSASGWRDVRRRIQAIP